MEKIYLTHGISFRYPEDWELSVQPQEQAQEIEIIVDSPQTSFWGLTLFFNGPQAEEVIKTALRTFQEEYDEIDIYPSTAKLCGRRTIARDLQFVCMDLINSTFLRAFETDRFTALVLFQATDNELDKTLPLLERLNRSMVYNNLTG